jgi:hypothetical protein
MKAICKHGYPFDLCGTCNPPNKEAIPINVQITPRLVAAILATGQKLPPGSKVVIIPPPPQVPSVLPKPKQNIAP